MSTTGMERAYETTKQIITLSSGILAFTVTFAKEFTGGVPCSLKISWLLYSVIFGVWTLMAITGNFERLDRGEKTNPKGTTIPAQLMVFAFVGGVLATMVTGVLAP